MPNVSYDISEVMYSRTVTERQPHGKLGMICTPVHRGDGGGEAIRHIPYLMMENSEESRAGLEAGGWQSVIITITVIVTIRESENQRIRESVLE